MATPRARLFALVFLGAIAFRILLFFSGLIDVMYITHDSPQYVELAKSILLGQFAENGVPSMNRTPGYPLLLAAIYGVFGDTQLAVTGVQVALDALACALVADMALFFGLRKSAIALVAGLAITCLFTAAYSFQLMTETAYIFALTFAAWVLLEPDDKKRDPVYQTTSLRILLAGIMLGYAVLVRPAIGLPVALFPAAMLVIAVLRERRLSFAMLRMPAIYSTGVAILTFPWMVRNVVTFPEAYASERAEAAAPPDALRPAKIPVTLLGYKSCIRDHDVLYMPEFNRFLYSYEEPYVQLYSLDPPVVARYVYPGEEEEAKAAFTELRREGKSTGFTKPTLALFERITEKRFQAAPRLYLTAPLSKILRIWISPRIAVLWEGKSGHNSSLALIVIMTIYGSLWFMIGWPGAWWGLRNRSQPIFIYLAAMIAGHTYIYALWMPFVQSRYAVPLFPLLGLAFGFLVERMLAARDSRVEPLAGSLVREN